MMRHAPPRPPTITRRAKLALWVGAVLAGFALPVHASSLCAGWPDLCDLEVSSDFAEADLGRAIDVVFVGDGFTSLTEWLAVAGSIRSTFESQQLAGLAAEAGPLLNFHVVHLLSATSDVADSDPSDTALGMRAVGTEFITADQFRANLAALNAPDVDVVVAVANSAHGRPNASYPTGLLSGGSVRISRSGVQLAHELGHALFHLGDEYTDDSSCAALSESALLGIANLTAQPTCAKFAATPGAGCEVGGLGCASGVYHPTSACLMHQGGNTSPCPVCGRVVSELLAQRLVGRDLGAPWAVWSEEGGGGPLTSPRRLGFQVHDQFWSSTYRIAHYINGRYHGQSLTSSMTGDWVFDPWLLGDGTHTLGLLPEDSWGYANFGHSVSVNVAVDTDTTPPKPNLVSPTSGSVVFGVLPVAAWIGGSPNAADPYASVAFVDNIPVATWAYTSSIQGKVPIGGFSPGLHTFRLSAFDLAGNVASTADVPFVLASTVPLDQVGVSCDELGGAYPGLGELCLETQAEVAAPSPWQGVCGFVPVEVSVQTSTGWSNLGLRARFAEGGDDAPWIYTTGNHPGVPTLLYLAADASALPEGPHELVIEWESPDGPVLAATIPVIRLPDQDCKPAAGWRGGPSGGQWVSGPVKLPYVAELCDSDDAEIHVARGSVEVGTGQGATGAVLIDTSDWPSGCHWLTAVASDDDGCGAALSPRWLCTDNEPIELAQALPRPGEMLPTTWATMAIDVNCGPSPLVSATVSVAGGAQTPTFPLDASRLHFTAKLPPGESTVLFRVKNAAGKLAELNTVLAAQACTQTNCNDQDPCTVDTCDPWFGCRHRPLANCCTSLEDCESSDPCIQGACVQGVCVQQPVPGCCTAGIQCGSSDGCSLPTCVGAEFGGTCEQTSAGCCQDDSVCPGAPLVEATCVQGADKCARVAPPGAQSCEDAGDCAPPGPFAWPECLGGQCVSVPGDACPPGGCDDGDPCTVDLCVAGGCSVAPVTGCCSSDLDCESAHPCGVAVCELATLRCTTVLAPDCCAWPSECNDGNPCTFDLCSDGVCVYPEDPCCGDAAGCAGGGCPANYGDINGDGAVSITDVQCAILSTGYSLFPSGPMPECLGGSLLNADLSCSGSVTVADAVLAIQVLLSLPIDPSLDKDGSGCPDSCE
jgi:hypothetical protein